MCLARRCLERRIGKMVSSWFCNTMKIYQPPISAKLRESAKTVALRWFCKFFWQMARWLVKILKTLINTGESGIVYCMECRKYVGLTLTWDVLKRWLWVLIISVRQTINFNMGCIETIAYTTIPDMRERLTLTWDVLKHYWISAHINLFLRLTLTWDVLKPVQKLILRNQCRD